MASNERRQKRIRFYSAKYKRHLTQQRTKVDIHKIFGVLENPSSSSIPTQTINPSENERLSHASDNELFKRNLSTSSISTQTINPSENERLSHASDNEVFEHYIHEILNQNDDSDCNSSVHSYKYPDFTSDDDKTEESDIDEFNDNEAELSNNKMTDEALFIQDIATWMRQFRTSRESKVNLLRILNFHTNVKFPKDPRKLLHTPTSTDVKEMCQGQYWHSGLRNAIINILNKRQYLQLSLDNKTINLFINIDGAPLGKSTQKCLWPILCSDDILKEVDVVGIYYGEGKPNDSNKYLEPFINEAILLINEGIDFNNFNYKINYKIRIKGLICDAPAKAYILMVKGHNGYDSCTKCCIHGIFLEHKICFPGFCDVLRTDEMFENFNYNLDYQIEKTKLINIPYLGLVSNVPLDYMHLVCLGVMRKLIQLWLSGPIKRHVRLSSNIVREISDALTDLVKFIPSDFNRKPRALKYLKYWKATELRLFLLYLGPLVLRKRLSNDVYNHFLELHVAITILTSPVLSLNDVNVSYAEQLLNHFVSCFETLYGNKYISHNVHNLQHIAADVRKFGAVDEFSAFRFENFIGILIKLVKKGEKPLQQISRRLKDYELTSHKKKF